MLNTLFSNGALHFSLLGKYDTERTKNADYFYKK